MSGSRALPADTDAPPAPQRVRRLHRPGRPDRLLLLGIGLVVLQLAYRAWAVSGAWFAFDDLAFISRALNSPLDSSYLMENYGGHLMPGGFLVTWFLAHAAPFEWAPWATLLLAMQAVASFGMLRLLRAIFGNRPLVLLLLAGYLGYVVTMPAFIWWAAGINQLPLQIALVFGLKSHLDYLRDPRGRHLWVTLAWTAFGLCFYEKTLLLPAIYAIVALSWFSEGITPDRVKLLWQRYRTGIVAHGALAVGYLILYVSNGVAFAPGNANQSPWLPIAYKLVLVALVPALVGGPLTWHQLALGEIADPGQTIVILGWAAVAAVVWYAYRTRTRSLRAWFPLLAALAGNVVLLAAGRAFFVGTDIALEYRYSTEAAALFVICAGLAFVPMPGAVEPNELREPEAPRPYETVRWVLPAALVVALLAAVSTQRWVSDWQDRNPAPTYVSNIRAGLADAPVKPVPLADLGLPLSIMWAYRYPENTYSHVLRMYDDRTSYPDLRVGGLFVFDDLGELRRMAVQTTRSAVPTHATGCPIRVPAQSRIRLDGPVIGGGWWVQAHVRAPEAQQVRVVAGDDSYDVSLPKGASLLDFRADGDFHSISMISVPGSLCVEDLTLGLPTPGDAVS